MTRTTRVAALLAVLSLMTAACGADSAGTEVAPTVSVPGLAEPEPSVAAETAAVEPVTDAELASLVVANNGFAADLYRVLADDSEDNLALGPWSISEGLALPYTGARGATADQMADVLGYVLPGDTQHEGFWTLRQQLRARQNDGLSLTTANRLFGQEGFTFLDSFLADQSRFYEAPLGTLDFASDAEAAREAINDWTAARTNDLIADLFPPGSIVGNTKLVLVNAIHLDANWFYPFNKDLTRLEPFARPDGSTINAEMMSFNEFLPSVFTEDYSAVQLPYEGQEMSMVVLLPRQAMASLEAGLDADLIAEVQSTLIHGGIHLGLPKFEVSYHTSLVDPLRELGLELPFDDADFSGMTGAANLRIAAIEHEAFVQIDETGTEAAAATGTDMADSHGPTISFDKPFLFWVQDDVTGQVLFLGRINDPDPVG